MTIIPADQVERLVMPDAWAYYQTLPALDLDTLLSVYNGNVRLVAAEVLTYAAAGAQGEAAAAASGGIDIKLGSLAIKESAAVSNLNVNAQVWLDRARAYRVTRLARSTPFSVSVSVEPA